VSDDFTKSSCVRSVGHTGDHRGVLWIAGIPSDFEWRNIPAGQRRKPGPASMLPSPYVGKRRAEATS
jgi:hypothetical protein